jgi:uncharacterized protein (DUF111 family)
VLETNIDDSTGENLGFTMDKLLEKGARDVCFTPIYMKKNRPANKLTVVCDKEDIDAMETIIFKNTSSVGIRKIEMERTILDREIISINTKYGSVRFKVSYFQGERYYYPEYEDIKDICDRTGIGYKIVHNEIRSMI